MTNKEAIEVLNYLLSTSQSEGAKEAHKMAVEALEKQEPIGTDTYSNEQGIYFVCRKCGTHVFDDMYCPCCGQRLLEETE